MLKSGKVDRMEPQLLISHLEKRSADKEWLLHMLHFVDEDCPYFKADYRPPIKKKAENEIVLTVEDPDGFYAQPEM